MDLILATIKVDTDINLPPGDVCNIADADAMSSLLGHALEAEDAQNTKQTLEGCQHGPCCETIKEVQTSRRLKMLGTIFGCASTSNCLNGSGAPRDKNDTRRNVNPIPEGGF